MKGTISYIDQNHFFYQAVNIFLVHHILIMLRFYYVILVYLMFTVK